LNIAKWPKSKEHEAGMMVRVTVEEALRLISSLAEQIRSKSPNASREEFNVDGEYFSIAVQNVQDERNSRSSHHRAQAFLHAVESLVALESERIDSLQRRVQNLEEQK
jgi:hypothetical protein